MLELEAADALQCLRGARRGASFVLEASALCFAASVAFRLPEDYRPLHVEAVASCAAVFRALLKRGELSGSAVVVSERCLVADGSAELRAWTLKYRRFGFVGLNLLQEINLRARVSSEEAASCLVPILAKTARWAALAHLEPLHVQKVSNPGRAELYEALRRLNGNCERVLYATVASAAKVVLSQAGLPVGTICYEAPYSALRAGAESLLQVRLLIAPRGVVRVPTGFILLDPGYATVEYLINV
ncbi:Hypothetical Protein FCC1311_058032 [Hondaea fermentalgiana]|uniref:Uncharacterized protein n=1 Tax=Hondaea fermentalgiana TaxID=2315210 RepID=A0A2R5GF79_9STRA|nr:Hypothetical Protein FCC1311_058032 [Hondaea fermentalgiana]|eukprot:GBG29582.1 Hypothetical Protein FCC1311_058032 [Hondaea fermentalgiana]